MHFTVTNTKENITTLARKIGYYPTPYSFSMENEFNFIKSLSSTGYPRFHLYIKYSNEKNGYIFNLHLDQKKSSYKGSSAHSGEYEGDLIEKEAERIKNIIG